MPTPPLTQAQLLTQFADNSSGSITALDVRNYVQSVPLLTNNLSDVLSPSTAATNLGVLALAGGTMTGNINLGGHNITNSATITVTTLASSTVVNSGTITASLTPASNTIVDGFILTDTVAATNNNQQCSPALHLIGQGWKTTSTAASQTVEYRGYVVPVQGSTHPTGLLTIDSQVNGGGYATLYTLDTSGNAIYSGGLTFNADIYTVGTGFPALRLGGNSTPDIVNVSGSYGIGISSYSGSRQLFFSAGAPATSGDIGLSRTGAGVMNVTNGSSGGGRLMVNSPTDDGTTALQVSGNISATGTLTGTWAGVTVAVNHGGTGQTTAANARGTSGIGAATAPTNTTNVTTSAAGVPTKVTATLTGTGSATAFTVTHNLNTTSIIVSIQDSGGNLVYVDWQATTVNSIVVTFGVAPANTVTYQVTILG